MKESKDMEQAKTETTCSPERVTLWRHGLLYRGEIFQLGLKRWSRRWAGGEGRERHSRQSGNEVGIWVRGGFLPSGNEEVPMTPPFFSVDS